ncbi:hypothetical protein KTO58_07235 [Chitinophaga pendula]|uniref:hypothetical protein n=1 Tax=Chitinophaga TaxID=79328 RepID=UPI0012FDA42B|nr:MULTISPECIES: hypothetical protein [Chitinophaga]UCJ08969.1 hypothetical protein KTO58_07235 [Chitinophaga pendula]
MKKQTILKRFDAMSRNELHKVNGGGNKVSPDKCPYGKKCGSHADCGPCACWRHTATCNDWVL